MLNRQKYGDYEFDSQSLQGNLMGKPENWRKLSFDRELSSEEMLLMGNGGGSAWTFEWEKGSFEVEFRVDGYNHFVCTSYPAHSHWSLDETGKQLSLNWDKYGQYELVIDVASRTMQGCAKGNPASWSRATFLRGLGLEALTQSSGHDHSHVHGPGCTHDH